MGTFSFCELCTFKTNFIESSQLLLKIKLSMKIRCFPGSSNVEDCCVCFPIETSREKFLLAIMLSLKGSNFPTTDVTSIIASLFLGTSYLFLGGGDSSFYFYFFIFYSSSFFSSLTFLISSFVRKNVSTSN